MLYFYFFSNSRSPIYKRENPNFRNNPHDKDKQIK